MKQIAIHTIFAFLMTAPLLAFDGVINYKVSEVGGSTHKIQYRIKGPRVRVNMDETENQSGSVLIDQTKNSLWFLIPEKKLAVKQELMPSEKEREPKRKTGKKTEFIKTGRRQLVAGRDCEVYTFSDEATEGEVCTAQGMGSFAFSALGGLGKAKAAMSSWERDALAKGYFPLKMKSKNIHSGKTTLLEATRIEPKAMDAAEFQVPSDFKTVDGFEDMITSEGGAPSKKGAMPPQDFMKKMMNASPEEREKMAEEMRKQFGGQ